MRNYINKIIQGIIGSFDTSLTGFSGRKLTGFILVGCVVAIHVKYLIISSNVEHLENVLLIDYAFVAGLFGMTTYTTLKTFKNEKSDSK